MIYISQPLEELGITEKLVKRVGVRSKNESQDLSISKCHKKKEREKVKQSRYTPWRRLGGEEV
jgi:hypothetical protein